MVCLWEQQASDFVPKIHNIEIGDTFLTEGTPNGVSFSKKKLQSFLEK